MSTFRTLDQNQPHSKATDSPYVDPELPGFTVYVDDFEPDAVYVRADVEFDADNQGVTLRVPVTVWNRWMKIGPRPLPTEET